MIQDPFFERYITEGLVNFSTDQLDTHLDVVDDHGISRAVQGMAGIYGPTLPAVDSSLDIVSMLDTSNADGCLCPALLYKHSFKNTKHSCALILARGGCSFHEKSVNAQGLANLLVVVDERHTGQPFVRPILKDEEGNPMPVDQGYPAVVFVGGSEAASILHKGEKLVLTRADVAPKIKLLLKDEEVQNIEVNIS